MTSTIGILFWVSIKSPPVKGRALCVFPWNSYREMEVICAGIRKARQTLAFCYRLRMSRCRRVSCYHDRLPWQEGVAQLCVAAFHPKVLTRFLTPFMCVAAFTVVEL